MQTTATDFKTNLGKYLLLAHREDISITKNGTEIAVLTAPKAKSGWVNEIVGIISEEELARNFDHKKFKAERLINKYESLD